MTISSEKRPRRRARRIVVLGTAAAAAFGVAGAAVAAPGPTPTAPAHIRPAATGTSPRVHTAQVNGIGATHARYALPVPECGTPSPGQDACMAVRLVDVPKGTPGAKAYDVPATVASGPAGGYTPADLAAAYGYNPASSTGASQTVAIVDGFDDPTAASDLNAFDAHYGLPRETTTTFRKVNQNGAATPLPAGNTGWAGEIALDVETVRAVCNHCKIILVEAATASSVNLATAVNTAARMGATEISNSYGGPESSSDPASIAAAYKHPGIVITASTGDHGWYDWDYANEGSDGASDNAPNTPAGYPTVVAVGGTALEIDNGSRTEEDVWNENGPDDENGLAAGFWWGDQGASGGGCSFIYNAPAWQSGAAGYGDTGCGTKRQVGDVAALADPYTGFDVYSTYGGSGWGTTGGTSLASPLIAAMWALAGGSGGVAYPAQSLYDHLKYAPSSIYDVQLGGNSFCAGDSTTNCSSALEAQTDPPTGNPNNIDNGNSQWPNGWAGLLDCSYPYDGSAGTIAADTQCNAVAGYDGPSGVGTPNGLNLFKRMGPSVAMHTPSLLKVNVSEPFSATFSDSIPSSTAASYHWAWGDGSTTTTSSASTSHKYTAKGTYTIQVTVTDNHGRTSPAVAKKFTLGVAPTVSISGATTVHHNTTHTWTGTATDHNTGGKITAWSWKIGTKVFSSRSTLTHKFVTLGTYKITLTVTDNSGLHATKTLSVKVIT